MLGLKFINISKRGQRDQWVLVYCQSRWVCVSRVCYNVNHYGHGWVGCCGGGAICRDWYESIKLYEKLLCGRFLYQCQNNLWELGQHMMTSSNGKIFRVTGPLCGEFTSHRWIPPKKASEAELWCFLWSAPWINHREAGDLLRHRAPYDVIVMDMVADALASCAARPSAATVLIKYTGNL